MSLEDRNTMRSSLLKTRCLWIVFLLLGIGFLSQNTCISAKKKTPLLEFIRIGDYPNYTQIALELDSDNFQCETTIQKKKPESVVVKFTGIECYKKTITSENPAFSEIKFSRSSSTETVTLTILLTENADSKGIKHHIWKDMVIVDIPLKKQNPKFPTIEEIKAFKEKGGKVIILDPGHGAFNYGACGQSYSKRPRLQEKEVALDVCKRLKARFDKHPPKYMTFLTRYDDYLPAPFGEKGETRYDFYSLVSLPHRVQMAMEYCGDMFISVHLNGLNSKKVRGFEILYYGDEEEIDRYNSNQNIDLEEWLSIGTSGNKEDHSIFSALKRDRIPRENKQLAAAIVQEITKIPGMELRPKPFVPRQIRVLKQLNMPSVLTELGFVTNNTDHEFLRLTSTRDKIAESLYTAVEHYFKQSKELTPTALASNKTKTAHAVKKIQPKPAPAKTTVPPQYHVIRRDESLSVIASKYGISIRVLKALNKGKIKSNNTIIAGDKLLLPKGIQSQLK